jgi:hypothetical protein
MHQLECTCAQCRQRAGAAFEVLEFGETWPGKDSAPALFSAQEELQLAMELLDVSSEEELEQFSAMSSGACGRASRKWARASPRWPSPGRRLEGRGEDGPAFVGGALGSMIPIPGVGTALGTALGRAASSALELEMAAGPAADRELDMARRFVRIAGQAARLAAEGDGSPRAVESALTRALHQQLPHFRSAAPQGEESGRWRRRGNRIVVMGDWT